MRRTPGGKLRAYLSGRARPAAAPDEEGAGPPPPAGAVRWEVARMHAARRSRARRRALALAALAALLAGALLTLAEPGSPIRDVVGRLFFWAGVSRPP